MEESVSCPRTDGGEVVGPTCSEWKVLLRRYSNLSEKELIDIRDIDAPNFDQYKFAIRARMLNAQKERENRREQQTSLAAPLFMLLSVQVIPSYIRRIFPVYGEITSQGYFDGERAYFYKREYDDADYVGDYGGFLTLNGPVGSCCPTAAFNILSSRRLSVKLYERRRMLVDDSIILADSDTEVEKVNTIELCGRGVKLIFKYVSIPMASYGRLELKVLHKSYSERKVQLYGKVVAKYKNTYGNYDSEEIVLFHKNPNEYETIVVGPSINLLFPRRHWLAAPAYSVLLVHLDLFEFGTNQQILNKDVEMEVEASAISKEYFTSTEFVIRVFASWFDPYPPREFKAGDDSGQEWEDVDDSGQEECEDADDSGQEWENADDSSEGGDDSGQEECEDADDSSEGGDDSGQEECEDADDSIQGEHMDADDSIQGEHMDAFDSTQREPMDAKDSGQGEPMDGDGDGDGVQISRTLRPCTILRQFSAFEVFSVLICHKKCRPSSIHGRLQFSFDLNPDFHDGAITIFKKGEQDRLRLSLRRNIVHEFKGSRRRKDNNILSVSCDLKDALGELSIKGIQSCCQFDPTLYLDRPLCSIFQGDRGFAALHYALFTSAVQANFKVLYTENGLKGVGVPVEGNFYAEYNNFDCSSWHEKNCYKVVLFERLWKQDSSRVGFASVTRPGWIMEKYGARVGQDGLIPLSRSSFVVPSISSFTLHAELVIGTRDFFGNKIIKTKRYIKSGDTFSWSIKDAGCEVKIDLEWSEVQ